MIYIIYVYYVYVYIYVYIDPFHDEDRDSTLLPGTRLEGDDATFYVCVSLSLYIYICMYVFIIHEGIHIICMYIYIYRCM